MRRILERSCGKTEMNPKCFLQEWQMCSSRRPTLLIYPGQTSLIYQVLHNKILKALMQASMNIQ